MRRAPVTMICVAAVIAVAAIVLLGGTPKREHRIQADFTAALQVFPGDHVTIAGRVVGSVRTVRLHDGLAVLSLAVDDDAWPLHQGTIARLREGSVGGYAQRFIELYPGSPRRPSLPAGSTIGTTDTVTPVEADQLYRMFGPSIRPAFGTFLDEASATLAGHSAALRGTINGAAAGLPETNGLLDDLNSVDPALAQLVTKGAQVTGALAGDDTHLQDLTVQAAGTLNALATNATALRSTLAALPSGLRSARRIVSHTNTSLGYLQGTLSALAPGAVALRQVAPVALHVVRTLTRVTPPLTSVLRTAYADAPHLTSFLSSAQRVAPSLATTLSGLTPMVSCILPYGPEISGAVVNLDSTLDNYGQFGHYIRDGSFKTLIPIGTPLDAEQEVQDSAGLLNYAFPRPPGLNGGHPRFLPKCGITPSALDASDDPEHTK